MKEDQIHPRMLERIQRLRKNAVDQLLDPQVDAYSQLSKATKVLGQFDDAEEIPGYRETGALCAKAAKAVRRQAIEGLGAGDIEKLRQIYKKLAAQSRHIIEGLTGRLGSSKTSVRPDPQINNWRRR